MDDSQSHQSALSPAIEFREGMRITLASDENLTTRQIVELALNGSTALKGKPVRCIGVVPGVTTSVSTGRLYPCDGEEAEMLASDIWTKIEPELITSVKMRTAPVGMTMKYGDTTFFFGWDGRQSVSPGAMEIEVHGPRSSLRKVAFIGPTIVRPDRLSVDFSFNGPLFEFDSDRNRHRRRAVDAVTPYNRSFCQYISPYAILAAHR